jgi:RING finger protein 113A
MFKKRNLNKDGLRRKRARSDDLEHDDDDTGAIQPITSRPAKQLISSSSHSQSNSGTVTSVGVKASGGSSESRDNLAVASNTIDGKDIASSNDNPLTESEGYRGQSQYHQYVEKRESTMGNKMSIGPVKASSNIRITNRMDYQPDVCKDYKLTGYCGYGDSCIFLHDRTDYKAGWQIDREWEQEQRRLKEAGEKDDGEEMVKDDLPFACLICKKDFNRPVVTKCGHYFCEQCAMKRFKSTPKCFACGSNTFGIFSVAKVLIAKLKERDARKNAK